MACEKTVGDLGKLDISNICLYKIFLTAWRSLKKFCPAGINSDRSKVDTFLQNGLSIHYRSPIEDQNSAKRLLSDGENCFGNLLLLKLLAISGTFRI